MGAKALAANPWPDECDLCGATMQPGHFNEITFRKTSTRWGSTRGKSSTAR
jgi:hypothetical protein